MIKGEWRAAPNALAHFYADGATLPLCKGTDDWGDVVEFPAHACRRCQQSLARPNDASELPAVRPIVTGEGRAALVLRLFAEGVALADAEAIKFGDAHAANMAAKKICQCAHCVAVRRYVARKLEFQKWTLPQIAAALGVKDHASVSYLLGRTKKGRAILERMAQKREAPAHA